MSKNKPRSQKRKLKPTPISNLDYLEAELHWVTHRCRRIGAERKQRDGADLKDRAERLVEEEGRLRASIDAMRDTAKSGDKPFALDRLVESYQLSEFERLVVLLALAPAIDQTFENHYARLTRDGYSNGQCATVDTAFAFCGLDFGERVKHRAVFAANAPLSANGIVQVDLHDRYSNPEDLLTARLTLNAVTLGYLVGDETLGDEFIEFSSLEDPLASFDQVVLPDGDKERVLSVVDRHDEYLSKRAEWGFDELIQYGRGAVLLFHGPSGCGKTMSAHAVAAHLGKRLLNVDVPTFIEKQAAGRFLPALFREARLRNAVLFFDEAELLFGERQRGNTLLPQLLTEIERFEGIAILATNQPERLDYALARRILVKVQFPQPTRADRLKIWQAHIPKDAPLDPSVDLKKLAHGFNLTGGLIKNAVLVALAKAVHLGDQKITMDHLKAAACEQLEVPLDEDSNLAQAKIGLDQVVLEPHIRKSINEALDDCRSRADLLDLHGLNHQGGGAVSVLLTGPSGTGKSMCAEAMAHELGKPVLKVAISTLLSKYIGQTEKNAARRFEEARLHDGVLVLEDADSIVQCDQSASQDQPLRQAILRELAKHEGLVVITATQDGQSDPGFSQYVTHEINFSRPKAQERKQLFELMLSTVPTADEIDTMALAVSHDLTGAQIRNLVIKALTKVARENRKINQTDLTRAAFNGPSMTHQWIADATKGMVQ